MGCKYNCGKTAKYRYPGESARDMVCADCNRTQAARLGKAVAPLAYLRGDLCEGRQGACPKRASWGVPGALKWRTLCAACGSEYNNSSVRMFNRAERRGRKE
jgi:hypothetical protein